MKAFRRFSLPESQVTPESVFLNRRNFMKGLAFGVSAMPMMAASKDADALAKLNYTKSKYSVKEDLTPEDVVTSYNNFYELGTGKDDPVKNQSALVTDNWKVTVSGLAEKVGTFDFDDLIAKAELEERIYRFRCVEAWSMVVPWVGVLLATFLSQFKPSSKAKYVAFESIYDPKNLPGQRNRFSTIDWPYIEGLRMDEAMNELAFMATGLYGKALPNQNGAPLRLVVPWKYGFKSIKSIVKIHFTEEQPKTTWNLLAPQEYGFYANVNPNVSHPRWSQAKERRLPSTFFNLHRIPTLMFNGYEEQVGHLYKGMDLARYY